MSTGSLRGRIATALAVPLLVLFSVGGGFSYWVARHYADRVYDRWLYDSLSALARQVRLQGGRAQLELPRAAREIFQWDDDDETAFAVVGSTSGTIAGERDLPSRGSHAERFRNATFFDAPGHGRPMRWVSLTLDSGNGSERVTVQVGETTHKRDRLADEIMFAVWVPELVLVFIVGWMAYRLISVQTDRIHRMSMTLRDYSYTRQRADSGQDMPQELEPLLEALNGTLSQLDRAALAQRTFIANAAHQLRTPLTALYLQAEQATHCTTIEDMRTSVRAMQASAQRTARLANQLLLLSRAEPDAQSNRYRARAELHAVAFDAASAWIEKAMAREIDLGFDERSAHVEADIDEPLVREAINNLIDNALKYCPPGARVTVSVARAPQPMVVVEDNGPGIPPAERERVVQRFYRGDNASGEGTGLGLAIVNEVATAHRGTFVILDAAGGGMRCEIRFPAAQPPNGAVGSASEQPSPLTSAA